MPILGNRTLRNLLNNLYSALEKGPKSSIESAFEKIGKELLSIYKDNPDKAKKLLNIIKEVILATDSDKMKKACKNGINQINKNKRHWIGTQWTVINFLKKVETSNRAMLNLNRENLLKTFDEHRKNQNKTWSDLVKQSEDLQNGFQPLKKGLEEDAKNISEIKESLKKKT